MNAGRRPRSKSARRNPGGSDAGDAKRIRDSRVLTASMPTRAYCSRSPSLIRTEETSDARSVTQRGEDRRLRKGDRRFANGRVHAASAS